MRILYGVVGEGMGHAIRSKVVIDHLLAQGHELRIMTSGRAINFLAATYPEVHRIHGLHIVAKDNHVRAGRTVLSNLAQGVGGIPKNIGAYFRMLGNFRPDLVISDFESWTHLYAQMHRVPVVSLDNIQMLARCLHHPEVIAGHRASFELTRRLVAGKMKFSDHYVVTNMFPLPALKRRTSVVPPVLRPEILRAKREEGDHLLVYQTFDGYGAMTKALRESGMQCRIYGMKAPSHTDGESVDGNLLYREFSEEGFVKDLATCKAVIGAGGFTLMSEAIYLRKPMLAVPLQGHFEQTLNSRYLQHFGYGKYTRAICPKTVENFLVGLERHQVALRGYKQDGNRTLFGVLDELIDRAEAGLYGRGRFWTKSQRADKVSSAQKKARPREVADSPVLPEAV